MRKSSFFFLASIVIAFVSIEGWILVRKVTAPRTYGTQEAEIQGSTIEVRSPAMGIVQTVDVQQGQRVTEGQQLFAITVIVTDRLTQEQHEEDLFVTALRPGMIDNLQLTLGMSLQSDQKVAEIVNNAPEVLYVAAKLTVEPGDVPRIRPMMEAYVRADFLNNGTPLRSVVSSVAPVYDSQSKTLEVRLRLVEQPPELRDIALGLPVEAWVQEEADPNGNFIIAFINRFLPSSEARQN